MNLIRFSKLLFAVIVVATLYSCRKDFSADRKQEDALQIKNDLTKTKLGKEKANPFSFEVVKKAIEKVKNKKQKQDGKLRQQVLT